MNQLQSVLMSINWSAPTWDVFIFLFFAIGALLYGLSMGRDRIVVILVSMYMALAVIQNTPLLATLNAHFNLNNNFILNVAYFVGAFVIFFFLLSHSALLHSMGGNGHGPWWQTIIFSVLQVGLLVAITLSLLPTSLTSHLSSVTQEIFLGDIGKSCWMVLPILAMAIMPKGDTA